MSIYIYIYIIFMPVYIKHMFYFSLMQKIQTRCFLHNVLGMFEELFDVYSCL